MLEKILDDLRLKLDTSSLSGLNERNTDRVFVSPLLEALGYDLANLDETMAGYHLKEVGGEISYAFFKNRQLFMLLEIRPLYSDLSAVKNLARVFAIARASKAPVLVVTNGVEWQVYANPVDTGDEGLVGSIDIRDADAGKALNHLRMSQVVSGGFQNIKIRTATVADNHNPADEGPIKNRGYKISESTHTGLNRLRTQIMTQREVRDQEITNSLIVENVLKIFLGTIDTFNYCEISNETILKRRIEEALARRFSS